MVDRILVHLEQNSKGEEVSAAVLLLAASVPWTPLFNGKDLGGWHQLGGKATYSVEAGEIVGATVAGTPNSFLCTDKLYGDFELEFDVKVDPQLNSGVQIRSNSVPGYLQGTVHGYQIEIDPSERAWSGGLYDESRRGWLQDLSKDKVAQKAFRNREWNHYRVVAIGDHFRTWVNGAPAVDCHDDLTSSGFIALQVHNHKESGLKVRWRNIRIKDLGVPSSKPAKGAQWLLRSISDTKNWRSESAAEQPFPWTFSNGSFEIKPGSGNIVTRRKFTDLGLHLEFMVEDNGETGQSNGNSGVYIMQSYEVQILNSAPHGPKIDECGALYLTRAPDYAMAMSPGIWQTYDIWFTAPRWAQGKKVENARITVSLNGTLVHRNVEIPGKTGAGAPESPEARPLRLQEHGCRVRFRNVWAEG